MQKNNDATKSKMRSKSTRKPFRDLSNAPTAIKPARIYKKTSEKQDGGDSLDRLHLVHSDLSSLLRQIDELVVQAQQLTSKKGRREIEQFADVLSEMQTSLKPWVPRLRKAVSSEAVGIGNKLEQPVSRAVACAPEQDTDALIESPEPTKWESLISPSPLVSWRAESNTEGGRQLFLLTPMHRTKTIPSQCQPSSIPPNEKMASDGFTLPTVGNLNNGLPKGVSAKPTADNVLNIDVSKTTRASPPKFSRMNCSMFSMTPLKMSPLKSCILLEPVSEISKKRNPGVHRSTPFPARVESSSELEDSEPSSSGQNSDDLTLRYPELFGIKLAHTLQNKTKVVKEELPDWNISPPKTCAIMEPSDEELSTNLYDKSSSPETTLVHNQQAKLSFMKESDNGIISKTYHQQDCSSVLLGIAESTPMMKEPASSFRTGKHPGENTLKKELWTRFEAATTHGICFNDTGFPKTAQNGFLGRLDEAYDE
ncbi:hypothetical protein ACJIZ3_020433 [Penstemon smallii]|uniref:Uncharacterized protein n=1 Tax=Penstemon smallii TaxID=265156 RepID=A0ABD3SIL0_9LAMI